MSIRTSRWFMLAALVVGCRPHRDAPAPAATEPPPRCAPFHVALAEGKYEPAALTALPGRTLLCPWKGPSLTSTPTGVVPLDPRESSIASTWCGPFFGRWPDDVWTFGNVSSRTSGNNTSASRWNGHAWEPFAQWSSDVERAEPWRGGLLVQSVQLTGYPTASGGPPEHHGLRIIRPGGKQEAVPESMVPINTRPLDFATFGDALFVVVQGEPRGSEARMSRNNQPPDPHATFASTAAQAHLWLASDRDVFVYGSAADEGRRPLFVHWDGEHWAPDAPPPGVDRLVAFDRTDAGAERVFGFTGDALSLWERPRGGAWTRIDLPHPHVAEKIDNQWLMNGEAWLHVTSDYRPGRLLRMAPVQQVYRVGKGLEAPDPEDACFPPEPVAVVDGGA